MKKIDYSIQPDELTAILSSGSEKTQIVSSTGVVAEVVQADVVKNNTNKVLLVQTIDANGNIGTGGSAVDKAAFAVGTDKGSVMMGVQSQDVVLAGKQAGIAIDQNRRQLVSVNPFSYLVPTHWTPVHGQAAWATNSTLNLTGFNFTVDSSTCDILSLAVVDVNGKITIYDNGGDDVSMSASANVLTISRTIAGVTSVLSAFASTDLKYRLALCQLPLGHDLTTGTQMVTVQNPGNVNYVVDSVVSVVNQAASTVNYPSDSGMSMDGYSDLTVNAYLIDANSVTSVAIQATNDPALTGTSWVDVTKLFSDDNAGINSSIGTGFTVSSSAGKGFALSRTNFNYTYFRFAVTTADATNSIYIWTRRKY